LTLANLGSARESVFCRVNGYGGLSTPEAKRLREMERENSELKHIVAELELDKRILKAALKHLGKA
jgi:hypothetical protein